MMHYGFKSWLPAIALQKLGEFCLLGIAESIVIYLGSRSENPFDLGLYNGPLSITGSVLGGFGVAGVFFIFTAYPVVSGLGAMLLRRTDLTGFQLALASAGVSVGYVLFWVWLTGYKVNWPSMVVTFLMFAFIVISSLALYPRRKAPLIHERVIAH